MTRDGTRPSSRPGTARNRVFDRAYFDRWYRHPRHRVKSALELERQARFVFHTAEYVLGRQLRRVLDVGCGEGQWHPVLRRLRRTIRYTGVDASEYAVRRFGRTRHVRLGTFDTLDRIGLRGEYDLILCVGMLNYVDAATFKRGLRQLHDLAGGLVYLETFAREDVDIVGDTRDARRRSARWYRREIARAGFVACGLHCYLPDRLGDRAATLERLG